MTWTDEAIEQLRTLASAGNSASEIGAVLGCTRNAVIGKLHRLALHCFGVRKSKSIWTDADNVNHAKQLWIDGFSIAEIARHFGVSKSSVERLLRREPVRRRAKSLKASKFGFSYVKSGGQPLISPTPPLAPESAHPISMLDLTNDTCRWIVSADGEPTLFCGGESDLAAQRSYCKFHSRVSRFGFPPAQREAA